MQVRQRLRCWLRPDNKAAEALSRLLVFGAMMIDEKTKTHQKTIYSQCMAS
jgi:hypothetical protein